MTTTPARIAPVVAPSGSRSGIALVALSSLAFGTSGTVIKPLLEAGWTPTAAVVARVLIAAAVLSVPAVVAMRGRLGPLWRARRRVLAYGVVAVAVTQLAYFAAVERIPVGTALLIEFLAPVLLVIAVTIRSRRMPARVVLAGSVAAVAGLILVIGPGGSVLDPVGVLFAALAALGLAAYFVLGAVRDDDLPPIALAAASLMVAGLVLAGLAAVGLLPFAAPPVSVELAGWTVPWFVPVAIVAVFSTALAYVTGIAGTGRLGSRVASFVGLLEVVFAAAISWLVLGEELGPLQLVGGALILAGVALVRAERRQHVAPEPPPA